VTGARLTRRGKKLRVLVVEDHALIALDLKTIIDQLGGDVVEIANSGERAVELTQELRPDVVLMDVRLAGLIDGIDAATAVAQVPGTTLIFVTGNTDPITLRRIERLGPMRVVPKPVLASDLLVAISEACGLDRGTQPCAAATWQVSARPRRPSRKVN
jgi:DNA-binding NarL/FixJ family response regulator